MGAEGCVLGLDYGSRRIGLAVSDPAGVFAFPAGALERKGLEQDLAALRALIAERGVTRVVVGLPLHLSGRSGPEAEAARAFARALGEATGLPVALLDERWTSREAERALRAAGERGRKRSRGSVDSVAATLLLRTFLERERGAQGGARG
jgi:putative Holliday junction resolvase